MRRSRPCSPAQTPTQPGPIVLKYLMEHRVHIGVRPYHGPNRGNLEWRPPSRSMHLTAINTIPA
jgi:hypothetical protein